VAALPAAGGLLTRSLSHGYRIAQWVACRVALLKACGLGTVAVVTEWAAAGALTAAATTWSRHRNRAALSQNGWRGGPSANRIRQFELARDALVTILATNKAVKREAAHYLHAIAIRTCFSVSAPTPNLTGITLLCVDTRSTPPRRIWSLIGEANSSVFLSGRTMVNRWLR